MNFLEVFKGTIITLKTNKMRSLLTMLGIIIGIASVITMWAIGVGGRERVLGDLKKIGYGKFTISVDYKAEKFRYKDYFDNDDLTFLKKSGNFKNVAIRIVDNFMIKKGEMKEYSYLIVSTVETEKISPVEIIMGRNFLPFEYTENENSVIIDNLSAIKLFGTEKSAVGKYIEISRYRGKYSYRYKIVGVFKNPFATLAKIFSDNDMPILFKMTYKAYNTTFNGGVDTFDTIILESKDPNKLADDMEKVKKLLEFYKNNKDIYTTRALSDEVESFDKILSTLSIFITLAASISLFVGGIGVMNIMLVTVIERTKEIGIRKALGAKNRDILKQFLIESVILTLMGGILGIILGFILAIIGGKIAGIEPIFSMFSILLSVSISVIVGIIFGVSPARKAAKLNPIDALRTE